MIPDNGVYKEIQNLHIDCSTGDGDTPVMLLKPVVDVITSPLTHNKYNKCLYRKKLISTAIENREN